MSIDPRARRLQLVTGKGGVGKTTLVAAMALAWAERGRRPLIVELGRRASIEGVLEGAPPVGWAPVEVAPGVHATNIDGPRAVLEVLARWLRVRRLAERAVRSDVMQAFLGAAPGVVEVATIERLFELLAGRWDPILVDADASGHALMFLGLPRVFEELGAAGPVGALLARTRKLFADEASAALHLVTLPGALPVQETVELDERLQHGGHVALGAVFVSRAPEALGVSRARITTLRAHAEAQGERAVVSELAWLEREAREIEAARARLSTLGARLGRAVIELPAMSRVHLGSDELRALGRKALEGVT